MSLGPVYLAQAATHTLLGLGLALLKQLLVCSLARLEWRRTLGHSLGQLQPWLLLPRELAAGENGAQLSTVWCFVKLFLLGQAAKDSLLLSY